MLLYDILRLDTALDISTVGNTVLHVVDSP